MTIRFVTEQSRTIGESYVRAQKQSRAAITLDHYLVTMTPLQAGKARKALEVQQGFDGVFMLRHQWAEAEHEAGATVDRVTKRVNKPSGTFYRIADVTKAAADYLDWLNTRSGYW